MFYFNVLKYFSLILLINFCMGEDKYEYVGCFKDVISKRMFPLGNFWRETNSVYNCAKYCEDNLYIYAGLQYGLDCWCGNRLRDTITYPRLEEEKCSMACTGNKNDKCGGNQIMSIYKTGVKAILRKKDGTEVQIVNDKISVV